MTNPNNIVRVRARNGGRASVYEANGWAQAFSAGLFEGNGVLQNTSADMNVLVGGSSTKPDVLIATNPAGYKIALDIVGQQAMAITAPASDSRITSIVAYTDDLSISSEETAITGSPATCGLIVVNGDASTNPVAPDDTSIRAAITADGATGSQAPYVVIANIKVSAVTTIITNSLISKNYSAIATTKLSDALDFFYPVGSYYETSDTDFDPNTAWGGTWVEDTAGRVLIANDNGTFTNVGDTGGAETHKHLTPFLVNHPYNWEYLQWNLDLTNGYERRTSGNRNKLNITAEGSSMEGYQLYSGDGSSLPPYIVIKRWHRTA